MMPGIVTGISPPGPVVAAAAGGQLKAVEPAVAGAEPAKASEQAPAAAASPHVPPMDALVKKAEAEKKLMAEEFSEDEEEVLGEGKFGRVVAVCEGKYARKCVHDEDAAAKEKSILETLAKHPNVVNFIDLVDINGSYGLVLELAESDLRNHVTGRSALSPPDAKKRARRMGRQLFSALAYCHLEKITHSDVKPDNILVFGNGERIALADFGSSALGPADEERDANYVTTVTYRAPELLAMQKTWDNKIDVWSAGLVYYWLLVGKEFARETRALALLAQITECFGVLRFTDPPLPFPDEYWNMYECEYFALKPPCRVLGVADDPVVNAAVLPMPALRKSAAEVHVLFDVASAP